MSLSTRSYGQRTLSVYGGAGGRGTRVSTAQVNYGAPSTGGFNLSDGLDLHVGANEKATLQNLNDRLASYLEKVRSLEKENDRLDKQIREWYQKRTIISHDYTSYFAIIDDLKDKVSGEEELICVSVQSVTCLYHWCILCACVYVWGRWGVMSVETKQ